MVVAVVVMVVVVVVVVAVFSLGLSLVAVETLGEVLPKKAGLTLLGDDVVVALA